MADQFIEGNGTYTAVGDPGCGSGYAGIGFNGLSGCNNYSMVGDGTNTFINRPSGGFIHFREGNGEQLTILSGGLVGIGTQVPGATLGVVAVNSSDPGIETTGFNQPSGSGANGTAGIQANGGNGDPSSLTALGGDGIFAVPGSGGAGEGYAGLFQGNVFVNGNLSKNSGSFKIDHPLDPANKYLYHSFVESPDMKNIYDGVVVLDGSGEAVVKLPEWFEALNKDFRYQLTAIGAPAPNLHVAAKVANNQFRIAGGQPGMEVSWQVTGTRQDAWANAHRIPVEIEKPERERGYYLHPELYGAPEDKSIEWARHPEMMQRMKARQAKLLQNTKQ